MDIGLEAGVVSWLTSGVEEGGGSRVQPWPVVVTSRMRPGLFRVRFLGDHQRAYEVVLARASQLRAFASNLHYTTTSTSSLRQRLVNACGTALDYIRENGVEAQRELTDEPGIRRLLAALDPESGTGASERYALRVADKESAVRDVKHDLAEARRELEASRRQRKQCQNDVVNAKNREKLAEENVTYTKRLLATVEEELSELRHAHKEATLLRFEPYTHTHTHTWPSNARARLRSNPVDANTSPRAEAKASASAGADAEPNLYRPAQPNADVDMERDVMNEVEGVVGVKVSMTTASANGGVNEHGKRRIEETVLEQGKGEGIGPGEQVVAAVVQGMGVDGASSTDTEGTPRDDGVKRVVYAGAVDGPASNDGGDASAGGGVPRGQGPATPTTTSSAGSASRSSGRATKARGVASVNGSGNGGGGRTSRGTLRPSIEGFPLERNGKRLRLAGTLPPDSPYMIAHDQLGCRLLSQVLQQRVPRPPSKEQKELIVRMFNADLLAYQREHGQDVQPLMIAGEKVNMYKLTQTLLSVGGMENTIRMRALQFVFSMAGLKYENSYYTNFIKTFYVNHVLPYEYHLVHGAAPPPGLAARILEESARKRNSVK